MALPAANYLKAQGHTVTWLSGKSVAPLIKEYTSTDQVIEVDEKNLFSKNWLKRLRAVLNISLRLVGNRFDSIYIAHSDQRYSWLVMTAFGKKISFRSLNHSDSGPLAHRHHSIEYLRLVSQRSGNDLLSPDLYLSTPKLAWTGEPSKQIVMAPGGAKNILNDDRLRRWPLENYVALSRKLIAKGFEVEIAGSESDLWVKDSFQDLPVKFSLGNRTIIETVDHLSKCKLLITHDSGPLHMGGLAGVPVLGLFGPTLETWRFPFRNRGRGLSLNPKLICQPCYDGKKFALCSENICLSGLTVDWVFQNAVEICAKPGSSN
jgi:heptosyltransferase-2